MMDDNRCFLAANHIRSLKNALLTVKYGARNALHSLKLYRGYIGIMEKQKVRNYLRNLLKPKKACTRKPGVSSGPVKFGFSTVTMANFISGLTATLSCSLEGLGV